MSCRSATIVNSGCFVTLCGRLQCPTFPDTVLSCTVYLHIHSTQVSPHRELNHYTKSPGVTSTILLYLIVEISKNNSGYKNTVI